MNIKRIYLLCIFLFISVFCFSQDHFALENFSVFVKDKTVVLKWTMKPGNTCFGIGIYRSENKTDFEEIGIIGGVCGSPDQPVNYTFVDSFPVKNNPSYYRLVLGLLGESQILKITYYDFEEKSAITIPNPVDLYSRIIFKNDNEEQSILYIYDAQGRYIYKSRWLKTKEFQLTNFFEDFKNRGRYYFEIKNTESKTIANGSFVY
jgi:hypothetical protein